MNSLIETRLSASLKYDAINGTLEERQIVAHQINEAIVELKRLRQEITDLRSELRDAIPSHLRATLQKEAGYSI